MYLSFIIEQTKSITIFCNVDPPAHGFSKDRKGVLPIQFANLVVRQRMDRLLVSFSHYNVSMDEIESFFADKPLAYSLFQAVQAMIDSIGESQVKVSKTQISFRNRIIFAITWLSSKRKNPPLMLTICLRRRDESLRWRVVAEPYPGRFVHHLELNTSEDLDDQVRAWLSEAWFVAS